MLHRSLPCRAGAVLLLFVACVSAPPGPTPASLRAQPDVAPEAALAREIALNRAVHKPGTGHRGLDAFVGVWSVRVEGRSRVADEFVPLARGEATIEWVLGERYLDWQVSLQVDSERHDVRGYLGYDVVSDEVQALWLSDLTTQMTVARGAGNPTGRGIVFAGREGEAGRSVMRVLDDATFVIETTGGDAGGSVGVLRRTLYVRAGR